MNILVIGSGGREHTIVWKLLQSKQMHKIFVAPGNAGTQDIATNLNIAVADFDAIIKACNQHKIDLVFVGPEDPLVNGIYDELKLDDSTKHITVIGPSKYAAQLEGSKSFAKEFMDKYQIPTAAYQEFDKNNYNQGVDYIKNHELPIVLKADGLAGGKGVVICETTAAALAEFEKMIVESKFGQAGNKVVVEAFLDGIEFSVFVLTDGTNYKLLPMAKDYKRVLEGDKGLNTGGMGAISPVPFVNADLYKKVVEKIVKPTIAGLIGEQMTYEGIIFIGLIKVNNEPYVIEYNCRLGDPETEVILPLLENDLADVLVQLGNKKLNEVEIKISNQHAATVVVASGGYPNAYETGKKVTGINNVTESTVFIAGAVNQGKNLITSGGRVLAVTSIGNTLQEAVNKSKGSIEKIEFENKYYRKDIGYEFEE